MKIEAVGRWEEELHPMKTTFKTHSQDNEGVDTATTGWGSRKPTPEERLEKVEEDVERIDKDVNILKNNLNIMD